MASAPAEPTSLASKLAAGPPSRESRCRLNQMIEQVTGEDRAALVDALSCLRPDGRYLWEHAALGTAIGVSAEAISRHRRGVCAC